MAIAMALGGYTGGEADALRRTMGNIRKKERLEAALERLKQRDARAIDDVSRPTGDAGDRRHRSATIS